MSSPQSVSSPQEEPLLLDSMEGVVKTGSSQHPEVPKAQTNKQDPSAAVEKAIAILQVKFDQITIEITDAMLKEDSDTDSEKMKLLMERSGAIEKKLKFFQDMKKKKLSYAASSGSTAGVGLAVTRRDLPMFQLSTDIPKLFPNSESFDTPGQFLSTFVKIIKSGRLDIEEQWKTLLPLCLHSNYDAWWHNDVEPHVHSWNDMVAAFKRQFGNGTSFGKNIDSLWTIRMDNEETISQYTNRFLRVAHEAKFNPKHFYVASFFVSSLVDAVRERFKSSWYATHTDEDKYTVQQASSLVSNILGGDYAVVRVSAAGSRSKINVNSSARAAGGSFSFVKSKKTSSSSADLRFFCKRHGANDSHGTDGCISLNKGKSPAKTRNNFYGKANNPHTSYNVECKYGCGQKWVPNHRCEKYYQSEDYKRKRAAEDRVVLSIRKADTAKVEEDTEAMEVDEAEGETQGASLEWQRIAEDAASD